MAKQTAAEVSEMMDNTPTVDKDGNFYFPFGDLGEGDPWQVLFNHKVSGEDRPSGLCKHCHSPQTKTEKWYAARPYTEYTCPRVVYSISEGGQSGTLVCLDCILEAVPKLPPLVSEPTAG